MSIYKKINGQDTKLANNSVLYHNALEGRDAYNAHKISSIRGLPEKLTLLKQKDAEIQQNLANEIDRAERRENSIEENAQHINIAPNGDGTVTFTNYNGNQDTFRAGHLTDNQTIHTINDDSTLQVIGVIGDINNTEVFYNAQSIYDDIQSASRIDLVPGENGKVIFTNYYGQQTQLQSGYLPDNTTINLQEFDVSYNQIELDENTFIPNTYYIYDDNRYVLADTYDSTEIYYEKEYVEKLVAVALQTGDGGVISGETIKQVISSQGGYLDSYNFETSTPTQDDLVNYAIEDIGDVVYVEIEGEVTQEVFDSYTYIYTRSGSEPYIYTRAYSFDPNETYYALNIWNRTRVINTYDNHTWSWDINSESWSDLGDIGVIADANNNGLHGLVTGAPNDGQHDYMGSIDSNGQIHINQLPELANTVAGKQDISDNALNTTSKQIVGAINELDSTKQDVIDNSNMLSSDLVTTNSDTNTNLFVTASEKSTWSGKQDALTAGAGISISSNTISADGLYYCSYEVTTLAEIEQALSDGLLPVCIIGPDTNNKYKCHVYTGQESGEYAPIYIFTHVNGTTVNTLRVSGTDMSSHNWSSTTTTIQETLVNQTNIKSINGESILGSGNMTISTYQPFPNTWTTDQTIKDLLDDVNADTAAVVGMAYLGEVSCTDLPFNGNAELVIEIMNNGGLGKVIFARLSSGNVSPYYWQYTYWNNGSNVSGWKSFLPNIAIDNSPTQNSTNLVTSGGVYDAVDQKQDTLIISNSDNINLSIDNTNHISATIIQNQYATKLDFPNVGSDRVLYVDLSDNSTWRFDTTNLTYICVGRDYTQIGTINGGNA